MDDVDDVGDEAGPATPAGSVERDPRWWLPWAGLVVGVWATLPKYSGPFLNTEASKEIADHVVPGILVMLAAAYALVAARRRSGVNMVAFVTGTVVLLAGFWMLATHIPLIAQAIGGDAPWPATIYHSSPSLAVFGLGLMWVTVHWQDLAVIEAAQNAARQEAPERASDPGAPS